MLRMRNMEGIDNCLQVVLEETLIFNQSYTRRKRTRRRSFRLLTVIERRHSFGYATWNTTLSKRQLSYILEISKINIQSTLDISNSDISNSAKFEASI